MENMNESFDKFNIETFFSNNEYFSSSDEAEEEDFCKSYHYMLLKGASEGFHSASGDADVEVPSNLELLNYVLSHADKYDKKELLEMSSKLGRRLKFRKCMEQKNKNQAAARAEAAKAPTSTPKSEPPAMPKPKPVEEKAVAVTKDNQQMLTPDFEVKKAALEKRKQDLAVAAGAVAAVAASTAREHKYPVVPTVNEQKPTKSDMEFLEFLKFQQQMVASRTQLVTAVAAAMQAKAAAGAAVPPSNSPAKPDPIETVSIPPTSIKLDIPNYHPPSRDDILYPTVILFQDGFKMGFHRIHKRDPEPQELPNQQIIVQEFVANNVRPGPDAVRLAHPMGEIMALKMAKERDPTHDIFKHEKK